MTAAGPDTGRPPGRRRGAEAAPGRGLAPVGIVLEALLARRGLTEKLERADVLARWEELVGPQIAKVARPAGLREGTLFVEVASASWSMELNMMRRRLLRRFNEGKKAGRIEKLVFVQADRDLRPGGRTFDSNQGVAGNGEGDR